MSVSSRSSTREYLRSLLIDGRNGLYTLGRFISCLYSVESYFLLVEAVCCVFAVAALFRAKPDEVRLVSNVLCFLTDDRIGDFFFFGDGDYTVYSRLFLWTSNA